MVSTLTEREEQFATRNTQRATNKYPKRHKNNIQYAYDALAFSMLLGFILCFRENARQCITTKSRSLFPTSYNKSQKTLALVALAALGSSSVVALLLVIKVGRLLPALLGAARPVLRGLEPAGSDPQEVVGLEVVDLVEEGVESGGW